MRLSRKHWNQGHLARSPSGSDHQRVTHRIALGAPADRLFERACLAGLPGWRSAGAARLSFSESGHDEVDAVWSEGETGRVLFPSVGPQTFWTTTAVDPQRRRLQAVMMCPELGMGCLDIAMDEQDGGTGVRLELSYTVLSETGPALLDGELHDRLLRLLEGFGRTLASSWDSEAASPVPAQGEAARQKTEYTIDISGDVDRCFALACPVAELLWIDGWTFDLIYSQSGKNEPGCVFLEPSSGLSMLRSPGAHTYWYTTRYCTEQHEFDAVLLTRDLTVGHWQIRMADLGDGQTRVRWRLTYTGLGPEGNRIVREPALSTRMRQALAFLAASMKHYVETGSVYRLSGKRKLRLAASLIRAALGRRWRLHYEAVSRAWPHPE